MIEFLIFGLWSGLLLGIPAGPNGMLVITRTIKWGKNTGIQTALGSVIAILLSSSIGLVIFSIFGEISASIQQLIKLISGLILLTIGILIIVKFRKEKKQPTALTKKSASFYTGTAFLTGITNPKNIIGWPLIIASGPTIGDNILLSGSGFLLGILISCTCWWVVLIFGLSQLPSTKAQQLLGKLSWLLVISFIGIGAWRLIDGIFCV